MAAKPRTPDTIAFEILAHMYEALRTHPGKTPTWVAYAKPYVKALSYCPSVDSTYGLEDARGIALYALSNLTSWRGEHARRLKADLKLTFNIK